MDPDGDFVVVWQSVGSAGGDTSGWSVQGQRFAMTADLTCTATFIEEAEAVIFLDGFESGDTSAWDIVSP